MDKLPLQTLPLGIDDLLRQENKPLIEEIAGAIDDAFQQLPNHLKPMLLDAADSADGGDAAFIAAQKLLTEAMENGGSSIEDGAGKASDAMVRGASVISDAATLGGNALLVSAYKAAERLDEAVQQPVVVTVPAAAPQKVRESELS